MRKLFTAKKIHKYLLVSITTVFCLTMVGEPLYAFDKDFFASNDILFYNDTCGDPGTDTASGATPSQYITAGTIPIEGMKVGASVFGGKQDGGEWVKSWADNGGNDLGDHGNHLTGTTSYAELGIYANGSVGDALGKLPDGTKLEIGYGGKKIIAVKGDVGSGGPDVSGKKRDIDLWWETANLLGFQDGTGVIDIHAVPADTPVTPLNGKPSTAVSDDTTASNTGSCCATADTTGGTLVGNTNAEKIWNFLVNPAQGGLTPEQAAGVMGNLKAESGYRPDAKEAGGTGYGIAQWSFGRRTQLEAAAKKKGVAVSDLSFQLDYLLQESKSRASKTISGVKEWDGLKRQTTIEKALVYWHDNFERSGDSPQRVISVRGGFANDAYKSFANKPAATAGAGASTATGTSKPVIFIDPGHGGAIAPYIDPKTGLKMDESDNSPEREDVLDIAKRIKTTLDQSGYEVVLSRTTNDEKVKFRERSDKAASVHAALALSIHTSPGDVNQVWPQRVGTFREYKGKKDTFTNAETAKKSENTANTFAASRTAAEGHKVTTDPGNVQETASFGRGGNIYSTGNIPFVSLWSPTVPWVYNEIGQDKAGGGISDGLKAKYTAGLIDAIKKSVLPSGQNGACSDSFTGGDFNQTLLAYAWPTHHNPPYFDMQPAYKKAVAKALSEHPPRYVGGGSHPGIDCGGFVTTFMVDSKYEPKYNSSGHGGNVPVQEAWMKSNWQSLGSASSINPADLKPGDVAISGGHTFIYVGKVSGFATKIASASYSTTGGSWRTPMAGIENPTTAGFNWYRKKA